MGLRRYRQKRDFSVSPEPPGESAAPRGGRRLRYVVQKHLASRLHYDFRLEWNGVLLSWAVPKGPSADPKVKRLAMRVEDHPVEYAAFEGVIPEGYGAGTVMVWDRGTWTPESDNVDRDLRRGELKFTLHGKKLKGSWVLVRTRSGYPRGSGRAAWLLIKHRDAFASPRDVAQEMPASAASGRTLAAIAEAGGGNVARAESAEGAGPQAPASSAARRALAKGRVRHRRVR
jgi:bifunctional non-homologous end joining protein LigD